MKRTSISSHKCMQMGKRCSSKLTLSSESSYAENYYSRLIWYTHKLNSKGTNIKRGLHSRNTTQYPIEPINLNEIVKHASLKATTEESRSTNKRVVCQRTSPLWCKRSAGSGASMSDPDDDGVLRPRARVQFQRKCKQWEQYRTPCINLRELDPCLNSAHNGIEECFCWSKLVETWVYSMKKWLNHIFFDEKYFKNNAVFM